MGFWTWLGNKIDGNFDEKTKNPQKPEPQPTQEDILWNAQFEMKQCIKRMAKNIREREEKVKNEFELVKSFLRAGDNDAARVHADAVAKYKRRITQSHKQLVTFELMHDKMKDGAFSMEATKILGDMAKTITGMADPAEVRKQLQSAARCEEIVNELGESLEDTTSDVDDTDVKGATDEILIQAANGVNTNTGESAVNLNGDAGSNEKERIDSEANQGLKGLEDLINGKK